ncbi:MAG: DUF308 domain-containing protein [Planctomycetes bacterium]|nr:DUF308 domain-containing protein [Planctomycetota bacterium]
MTNKPNDNLPKLGGIRLGLVATGIAMLMLGIVCVVAPIWFTTPIEWLIGGALFFSGLIGLFHWIVGLLTSLHGSWKRAIAIFGLGTSKSESGSSAMVAERGSLGMLVLLQLALGGAILFWPQESLPLLFFALLLAVIVEGGIVLWASFQFPSLTTKIWMWMTGLLSVAVAVVAFYQWKSPDADHWVGLLIGAKLILIGSTFVRVGGWAQDSDLRRAYVGLSSFQDEPTTGSIYAVYYGPAFHCGISVGDGQVVDYLTDGIVRLITWDEFLLGRKAMEWNYPDVATGTPHEIAKFATELVGKHNPYDPLKFNCENLTIYCRSVGRTTYSAFSQAAVGVEFVRRKPLLGSMVQLLNRGASWFMYGAGGPFGKRVGFEMIRMARALTDWVVVGPLRSSDATHVPENIYLPSFKDREAASAP